MAGALLLYTPPRSRIPAESALGSTGEIAEICAFAWELGGGTISDVLNFPPRPAVPDWASFSTDTESFEIPPKIDNEEASFIGTQVGLSAADGKRVRLICHETYGIDVSKAYWQAFSQAIGFAEGNPDAAAWNAIHSRYGRTGSPITVILGSSRTLATPPPPTAISREATEAATSESFLRGLYRISLSQNSRAVRVEDEPEL